MCSCEGIEFGWEECSLSRARLLIRIVTGVLIRSICARKSATGVADNVELGGANTVSVTITFEMTVIMSDAVIL